MGQSDAPASSSCSEEDGTCNNVDALIYRSSDGTVTIHTENYPKSSTKYYGFKLMRNVNKIYGNNSLRQKLEWQTKRQNIKSKSDMYKIRELIYDISTKLVEELLSLALLHKEEWMQIALLNPSWLLLDSEDSEDVDHLQQQQDQTYANDHFDKAINAYETVKKVYVEMYPILQFGILPPYTEMNMDSPLFSQYDKEAVSTGQASVELIMADMFHQRYLSQGLQQYNEDGAPNVGDLFNAYRGLITAESWCEESELIIGEVMGEGEQDADRDAAIREVKQTMALTKVRIGALLVDMYSAGYVLDDDINFRLETAWEMDGSIGLEPSKGQKRLLERSLDRLSKGSLLFAQLGPQQGTHVTAYEDFRLSMADCSDYMGTVYGHLLQWTDAADQFETSMLFYDQLFKDYNGSGMDAESLEMAASVIQTTQSLFEAYLNLPGRTADAREQFRRHLTFRRYFEWQTPLEQNLADEQDDGTSNIMYQSYDADAMDSQYQDILNTYQTMLDDYLQQIHELGPDGSYHEMTFGFDGINAARYVQHDKVYEGTLRSSIGSINLAKNQILEASIELELAVSLLKDGDRDYFEADGVKGEIVEYSVKVELANALLNLAYAQMGLKQWKRSYDAFEEAMELYDLELADGDTPMHHSGMAKNDQQAGWAEKLTSFFTGSKRANDETESLVDDDNEGSSEDGTLISIEEYEIAENETNRGIGII